MHTICYLTVFIWKDKFYLLYYILHRSKGGLFRSWQLFYSINNFFNDRDFFNVFIAKPLNFICENESNILRYNGKLLLVFNMQLSFKKALCFKHASHIYPTGTFLLHWCSISACGSFHYSVLLWSTPIYFLFTFRTLCNWPS